MAAPFPAADDPVRVATRVDRLLSLAWPPATAHAPEGTEEAADRHRDKQGQDKPCSGSGALGTGQALDEGRDKRPDDHTE
jgi:hypothetical protein